MKNQIKDYILITIGSVIVCCGFVFFINPYKFVPGGVTGMGIVLHTLMPEFQVGTFLYFISVPLLVLSYFLLGKGIGIKTLYATLITPSIMNFISSLVYPSEVALERLLPSEICGGNLDLSSDLILAAVVGPLLIGLGEGFIVKGKATSGGTDIIAMILHKYLRVRFSDALLATDAVVVLSGLLVIGFGIGTESSPHAWMLSLYSLICIFIMARTLAFVASGSKNNKLLFIVADKNHDDLRDFVLHRLDRTGTVFDCTGLYSREDRITLMMVIHMREVDAVITAIKSIDPSVFVIVTDAYDAYGTRWKAFPDKRSIELS